MLLDRFVVAAGKVECSSEAAVDDERKGIQFERASVFRQGLVQPPDRSQVDAIPLVRRSVAGLDLDCQPEVGFGTGPIPIVPSLDKPQRRVSLS